MLTKSKKGSRKSIRINFQTDTQHFLNLERKSLKQGSILIFINLKNG